MSSLFCLRRRLVLWLVFGTLACLSFFWLLLKSIGLIGFVVCLVLLRLGFGKLLLRFFWLSLPLMVLCFLLLVRMFLVVCFRLFCLVRQMCLLGFFGRDSFFRISLCRLLVLLVVCLCVKMGFCKLLFLWFCRPLFCPNFERRLRLPLLLCLSFFGDY